MGKKLAIKGHVSRGKEVIELLEMMGGSSYAETYGACENRCYFIGDNGWIKWDYIGPEEIDKYNILELEEFLEKYPFKVGDKVRDGRGDALTIKSMSWSEDYGTMVYVVYDFEDSVIVLAAEDLLKWNTMNDNTKPTKETITPAPDIIANITDKNNCDIQCPDGYEFYDENGNLIGTKVMMRPKKPKYPDDYEECVRIAKNIHGYDIHIDAPAYRGEAESIIKLLICRDAYRKIAGEEMGLGKPWEPDWNKSNPKYTIVVIENELEKRFALTQSYILAFPTEEIRDTFYENFKNLIEQCKSLL